MGIVFGENPDSSSHFPSVVIAYRKSLEVITYSEFAEFTTFKQRHLDPSTELLIFIVNALLPNTPAVPSFEIEEIIGSLELADSQFSAIIREVYAQFEGKEK